MEVATETLENERQRLTSILSKEVFNRREVEAQLEKVRASLASSDEKVVSLTEDLDDIKAKLSEVEDEAKRKIKSELAEIERQLLEAKRTMARQEKNEEVMNDRINHLETER